MAIDQVCPVDGRLVMGCPVTRGHWPVDLYSLGYKYPGSCHQYGSYPEQQGHKGQCSHVFFFFHMMKQTHLETSFWKWFSFWKSKFFSFWKFPAATHGASRFPGTIRTINTYLMIIPIRFYMTTITAMNSHESRKNSLLRMREEIISRNPTVKFSQI